MISDKLDFFSIDSETMARELEKRMIQEGLGDDLCELIQKNGISKAGAEPDDVYEKDIVIKETFETGNKLSFKITGYLYVNTPILQDGEEIEKITVRNINPHMLKDAKRSLVLYLEDKFEKYVVFMKGRK